MRQNFLEAKKPREDIEKARYRQRFVVFDRIEPRRLHPATAHTAGNKPQAFCPLHKGFSQHIAGILARTKKDKGLLHTSVSTSEIPTAS